MDSAKAVIDEAISKSNSYADFKYILRQMGASFDDSPNHKYQVLRVKGYQKNIRLTRLGDDYSLDRIKERIYENRNRVQLEPFQKGYYYRPKQYVLLTREHMKNGTMFSDLEKLKSKEFWEEHKTLRFDTLYVKQTYEVIAVFKTAVYTGSENEFRYYQFVDAATKEQFDGYIQRAKEKAFYDTGVSAEYGDKLITLSTCEYSCQNSRLVVVAKKVTESGGSNAPSNDGATEIQS